jgi:hypothetical protein
MADRIQLVAILGSALLFFVVLEMVRRRRLMERYALLWLLASVVLLGLGIWRNGLVHISKAIGIIYPPNALFFIAFGFVLLLLLHFSSAISRLSDQTKVLAQRQALLEERLRRAEESGVSASGDQDAEPALADAEHERPRYVRITRD